MHLYLVPSPPEALISAPVIKVGSPAASNAAGEQKARPDRLFEGNPEFSIKISVDYRVQGRIEIADPEDGGYHPLRAIAVVAAEGSYYIPGEGIKK